MPLNPEQFGSREQTIGSAQRDLTREFRNAGIDTPDLDARLLLRHVLGFNLSQLITAAEQPFPEALLQETYALAQRRLARVPMARLLGEKEFWGLTFDLNDDCLVPRPDTETLIEAAVAHYEENGNSPKRVLDLGTGTGCLLVSLLHVFENAVGTGVDKSPAAAGQAMMNAHRNAILDRTHFVVGDWASSVTGPFDLVVTNPPYIPEEEIAELAPEVARHDPHLALNGGASGLDAYIDIARDLDRITHIDSVFIAEFGAGQADAMSAIISSHSGFRQRKIYSDLAGLERCAVFRRCKKTSG